MNANLTTYSSPHPAPEVRVRYSKTASSSFKATYISTGVAALSIAVIFAVSAFTHASAAVGFLPPPPVSYIADRSVSVVVIAMQLGTVSGLFTRTPGSTDTFDVDDEDGCDQWGCHYDFDVDEDGCSVTADFSVTPDNSGMNSTVVITCSSTNQLTVQGIQLWSMTPPCSATPCADQQLKFDVSKWIVTSCNSSGCETSVGEANHVTELAAQSSAVARFQQGGFLRFSPTTNTAAEDFDAYLNGGSTVFGRKMNSQMTATGLPSAHTNIPPSGVVTRITSAIVGFSLQSARGSSTPTSATLRKLVVVHNETKVMPGD